MKKSFNIPYSAITVSGCGFALMSALFWGQTERPFTKVRVAFCPQTVNNGQPFTKASEEAQKELDRKYCRNEVAMLKTTWDNQQFESSTPLPEASLKIRTIKATDSKLIWFLVAPVSFGVAYISWAAKLEIDENNAHKQLEDFKTKIKLEGVSAREQRDFESKEIKNKVDAARVKKGHISVEAMEDIRDKQVELQDKKHASAIKQLELVDSDADKKISENLREAAKARKETLKYSDRIEDSKTPESSNEALLNALIEALKNHDSGWLWELIESVKPIFLIGDMGSAKTSFAVTIGLIREALGHKVYQVADKHLKGENMDKWQLLKADIKHDSNETILEALETTIQRREDRIASKPKEYEQFILDEFTQLAKLIHIRKDAKDFISLFITSTYSDTRKAKELFIGVTHNFTNATFGDGVYELRNRGWLIEKFSVDGEKPIPRVCIRVGMKDSEGNNLKDIDKIVPNWFQPELISDHLTGKKLIEF